MSDVYHLLTVADVQKDTAAIVEVLKGIHESRLPNDLRLLNYYREMPVSYDAVVSFIDEDLVELKVHQHQAVVMYAEKMTFLKSAHFPHDVVAKTYKVNVDKSVALLSRFSYAQIRAERRRFIRVEIGERIEIAFKRLGVNVAGRLLDISIGGLSLVSPEQHGIDVETAGILNVSLPNVQLEIPGRLIKIIPLDAQWRYIFELETDNRIEAAISQFIFQKQVEIIRELKDQLF